MSVSKTNSGTAPTSPTQDPSTDPKAAPADWVTLNAAYTNLQKTAYATQGVKSTDVSSLRDTLEAYVEANVTDETQKTSLLASINTDLSAMLAATDAHAKDGTTSNSQWDSAREDLESMLTELAPEGADAIWTPKAATTPSAVPGQVLAADLGGKNAATDKTGQPSGTGGASAAAGSVSGVPMISLDDMVSKFPQLAPYKDLFNTMGTKYGVAPQMLAAHAMQESHANPSEGNGGMMQFQNQGTWDAYGDPSIPIASFNESNVSAQVEGAAKYDAYLMGKHGGDLNAALLEYSGGLSQYPDGIKKWLSGVDGYAG